MEIFFGAYVKVHIQPNKSKQRIISNPICPDLSGVSSALHPQASDDLCINSRWHQVIVM